MEKLSSKMAESRLEWDKTEQNLKSDLLQEVFASITRYASSVISSKYGWPSVSALFCVSQPPHACSLHCAAETGGWIISL